MDSKPLCNNNGDKTTVSNGGTGGALSATAELISDRNGNERGLRLASFCLGIILNSDGCLFLRY